MNSTKFLNPVRDDEVVHDVGDGVMVADIVDSLSDTEPIIFNYEGEVESFLPAVTMQLVVISTANLILRSTCPKETGAVWAFGRLYNTLKEQKRSEQSQSLVTSLSNLT